jgi:hypothetical protein
MYMLFADLGMFRLLISASGDALVEVERSYQPCIRVDWTCTICQVLNHPVERRRSDRSTALSTETQDATTSRNLCVETKPTRPASDEREATRLASSPYIMHPHNKRPFNLLQLKRNQKKEEPKTPPFRRHVSRAESLSWGVRYLCVRWSSLSLILRTPSARK